MQVLHSCGRIISSRSDIFLHQWCIWMHLSQEYAIVFRNVPRIIEAEEIIK